MTFRQAWHAVNRHAAIYICLAFFAAICRATHFVAVMRIEACDGQFTIMDEGTMRNLALIALIRSNPWFPWLYAFLTAGGVAFMQLRKYPEWGWWLWSVVLCSPFALYLSVCGYIGMKFISP